MNQSLSESIEETDWKLILERIKGISQLPTNPFSQTELSFDYSKVDPKYHVNSNPDEEIILYKGAPRGYEEKGFLSRALSVGLPSHVIEVKEIIENGDDNLIRELFDQHTSYYLHTALLSATFNPEQAQVFAPTHPITRKKKDYTIYQLRIRANRCVKDCYDLDNSSLGRQILILGAIFPEEISAVKINNDLSHSELISPCGHYIRDHPDKNS
ncbi:MAG TPA: hypothetical protein ENG48_13290, partial [Candidatus Atribacteria bacterium]|nr:hypothetical protein [Candidatus Atribacteria bacterium]